MLRRSALSTRITQQPAATKPGSRKATRSTSQRKSTKHQRQILSRLSLRMSRSNRCHRVGMMSSSRSISRQTTETRTEKATQMNAQEHSKTSSNVHGRTATRGKSSTRAYSPN